MPAASQPARPYLQRPLPLVLIFTSAVAALVIPLWMLGTGRFVAAMTTMETIAGSPWAQIYICGLGFTHFFLTFTIYLHSGNLRHFASSPRNQLVFFAIPIAIFVFFDVYNTLNIPERFAGFAVALFVVIRFFDFLHFNRQNFGVHQLFKGKSGALFPSWMKKVENWYFMALVVLIFQTFMSADHRIPLSNPSFLAMATVTAVLFGAIMCGYLIAASKAERPGALAAPFGYLLMQSAAAGLAIYSSALYLFSLAVHYVEYHVLMAPRCFDTKLDADSRVDRLFGRLRRHKLLFYLLLLGCSGLLLLMLKSRAGVQTSPLSYRLLFNVFDGLFVFHYFVEAFIWKFGDPYFRKVLGPLYFPQPAPAVAATVVPASRSVEPAPRLHDVAI